MTSTTTAQTRIFHRRALDGALADDIRARLFAHEFLFRAPLDETALAAQYGVGHLPLSQALENLAREQLLAARSQAQGGYEVPDHARAEIENLLDTLEKIRRFALSRHGEKENASLCLAAVEMPSASRPYRGPSGLEVARPFVIAAQSLHDQLRAGVGPALSGIEANCARRHRDAMQEALAGDDPETLDAFCRESARDFRQRVLDFFDDAASQQASGPGGIQ
ncbi:MAG: GntR family transcriptional regulator [Zoogloeaceae bacterium]|nr:GntR family transcriptional regulator [Zoogloeaceae bacterium]